MLSEKEQALKDRLCADISDCKKRIPVDNINAAKKVLNVITYEEPSLFHISGFRLETGLLAGFVCPQYTYPRDKYLSLLRECSAEADEIAEKVMSRRLGEYDSALLVHDILAKRVRYKIDNTTENHSIIGALIYGEGCCESISKSYKFILDRLNIRCLCVTGTASDSLRGISGAHMWNMVFLKGKWCHVDVTFDLPPEKIKLPFHSYFGLDDRAIQTDHRPGNELTLPAAPFSSLEYYGFKKQKISNERDLTEYFVSKIKSKTFCFEAMLFEDLPVGDVDSLIKENLLRAMQQANFSASVNWVVNNGKRNFCVKIIPNS